MWKWKIDWHQNYSIKPVTERVVSTDTLLNEISGIYISALVFETPVAYMWNATSDAVEVLCNEYLKQDWNSI